MTSKNILSKIWRLQYLFSWKCDDLCLKTLSIAPCRPGFRLSPQKFKIKKQESVTLICSHELPLLPCASFVGGASVGRSVDPGSYKRGMRDAKHMRKKAVSWAICNRDLTESIIGGPKMFETGRLDAIQCQTFGSNPSYPVPCPVLRIWT
jgi:hypothetical protein